MQKYYHLLEASTLQELQIKINKRIEMLEKIDPDIDIKLVNISFANEMYIGAISATTDILTKDI